MARKKDVQTERTWLAVAVAFSLAGMPMIAATNAPRLCDPFLYVGAALCLAALWFIAGVFVDPRLLPKLPSEKAAERFRNALDPFLIEGRELKSRDINSAEEMHKLTQDHAEWVERVRAWLASDVSGAHADSFTHPGGLATHTVGSFNTPHSQLRSHISSQLAMLWKLLDS